MANQNHLANVSLEERDPKKSIGEVQTLTESLIAKLQNYSYQYCYL
jgi:hypothetical protein